MGLADKVSFKGEVAAVQGMCAAIPHDASVVILYRSLANQMAEVVRGMCGEPTAALIGPQQRHLQAVLAGIRRDGRVPVLLALSQPELAPYGGTMRRILFLQTRVDEHELIKPPLNTIKFRFVVWMSEPAAAS